MNFLAILINSWSIPALNFLGWVKIGATLYAAHVAAGLVVLAVYGLARAARTRPVAPAPIPLPLPTRP